MKKGFKYNMKNPSKASRSLGKPHIRMSDKKKFGEHPRSWENSRSGNITDERPKFHSKDSQLQTCDS